MLIATDPPPRSPAPGLLASGLWVGLLVGAAEAALVWSFRVTNARVTLEDLRVNRHAMWMIPVMDLAIFTAIGLALALWSIRRPNLARRIAGPSLAIPAILALLYHAYTLHWVARWVLAAGLGLQIGRLASQNREFVARLITWTLPATLAVMIAFCPFEYARVIRSESSTISALPAPTAKTPNVLMLVLDTVRADHLSLYGYERDTTPNLARLAESGVTFNAAIAPAPWTLPSHASMFTGRWPHELSTKVDRPLDRSETTLAEFLSRKGYATAGFVANTYYCNTAYGLDRGFARYDDFPQNQSVTLYEIARSAMIGRRALIAAGKRDHAYAGDRKTRKTAAQLNASLLSWIDGQKAHNRPFFGFVNYYDAHGPYQTPPGAPRRFGLSALPESERQNILQERHRITSRKSNEPLRAADAALMDRASHLLLDTYDDCLAQLDQELGNLFKSLEERGLRDDTIIIVTSDHGEHFGEHSLFGHGLSLYHAEVHVPLLIFAPGVPGGRKVERTVSLRDLPATVADLIDEPKSGFPGRSLAMLFEHGSTSHGTVLTHVEHQKKFKPSPNIPASRGPVHGLIDGRWSYVRHSDGEEELYDVEADPKQLVNLLTTGDSDADASWFREALDAIRRGESPPRPRTAWRASSSTLKK